MVAEIRRRAPRRSGFFPTPLLLLFSVLSAAVLAWIALDVPGEVASSGVAHAYLSSSINVHQVLSALRETGRPFGGTAEIGTVLAVLCLLLALNVWMGRRPSSEDHGGAGGH